jgi:hypothetical protein
MTSDMAFECLFVTRDSGLFRIVDPILRNLSIATNVCLSSSKAMSELDRGTTDLIVIDWDNEDSSGLLENIWQQPTRRKPTIVAISRSNARIQGAHVCLTKPVTSEAGEKSFKSAYSRMLVDYRQHARHAVMQPVVAAYEDGHIATMVVTDISVRGVGLSTKDVAVGDVFSFRLRLPGARREILVCARVLWTREYGRAGCEFIRIPPVDFVILHDWLSAKVRIKRPVKAGSE